VAAQEEGVLIYPQVPQAVAHRMLVAVKQWARLQFFLCALAPGVGADRAEARSKAMLAERRSRNRTQTGWFSPHYFVTCK
jgi:hypothetical protein